VRQPARIDWQAQYNEHTHRLSLDKKAAELAAATRQFREAMAKDRYGGAQKFAYFLWAAFDDRPIADDDALRMTSSVPADAVLKGLDRFAGYCEMPLGRGTGTFPFGPIHYLKLPMRLADREVALALELADLFSRWRADRPRTSPFAGRTPLITSRTPWKQLAQFVDAAFDNAATTKGLQKRVQVMAATNVLVWACQLAEWKSVNFRSLIQSIKSLSLACRRKRPYLFDPLHQRTRATNDDRSTLSQKTGLQHQGSLRGIQPRPNFDLGAYLSRALARCPGGWPHSDTSGKPSCPDRRGGVSHGQKTPKPPGRGAAWLR
jgi:hypothetical protein